MLCAEKTAKVDRTAEAFGTPANKDGVAMIEKEH
jgi:hypothetical protein